MTSSAFIIFSGSRSRSNGGQQESLVQGRPDAARHDRQTPDTGGPVLMQNKVVVHCPGEPLLKGITNDFFPNKDRFHLAEDNTGEVREISLADLKAVFFVKDFDGDSSYQERTDVERTGFGKKIQVDFKDGETLVGYCHGFARNREGFFVFPADPQSNNDRIFVITAATEKVAFL
jgi:hypothetical protein